MMTRRRPIDIKEGCRSIYEGNNLIIDFNNIPVEIVESFYKILLNYVNYILH